MSVFKCKMCGGTIEFEDGSTVGICDSCGTKQTLPRLDDDKKVNLYDRANHFRRNNDYDKAMGIYEQILNDDPSDAEAYWSIVLCRYGIEYVEDPASHKRVPTVNRMQYTSILADEDYKAALEHADIEQKSIYEQEAVAIDKIQKDILAISQKEEPFDVFICYKEADENGRRTQDSVLANDLYHQLTQEGFKVFFSRITLEDKIGTAYEPYIFAALNSARVMVVIGTRADYLNAVWVKNEWSRYLSLIRSGDKKTLIPAYRDMDPYDLPEEFSHLQALDMTRLGFMPDLIRGIKKILSTDEEKESVKESPLQIPGNNVKALIKRGYMALEDKEWEKADAFFEDALNQDAENGDAYIGKLLTRFKESNLDDLETHLEIVYSKVSPKQVEACPVDDSITQIVKECTITGFLESNSLYPLFEFDRTCDSYIDSIKEQKERFDKFFAQSKTYTRAKQYAEGNSAQMLQAFYNNVIEFLDNAIENEKNNDLKRVEEVRFAYSKHINEAESKARDLCREAEGEREKIYQAYLEEFHNATTVLDYERCKRNFQTLNDYKDTTNLSEECLLQIDRIKKEEKEQEQKALIEKQASSKKKRNKILSIVIPVISVGIIFVIVLLTVILPNRKYNSALELYNDGKYNEAITAFSALNGYKDSNEQIKKCETAIENDSFNEALKFLNIGDYETAYALLEQMDKSEDLVENVYKNANSLYDSQHYEEAYVLFETINSHKDSEAKLSELSKKINPYFFFKFYLKKHNELASDEELLKGKGIYFDWVKDKDDLEYVPKTVIGVSSDRNDAICIVTGYYNKNKLSYKTCLTIKEEVSEIEFDMYIDMDYYVKGAFISENYQLGQSIPVNSAHEIGGSYQFSEKEIEDAGFSDLLGTFAEGELNVFSMYLRDNSFDYTLKDFGFNSVD